MIDGFPLVEIGWTVLVFLSGYMFGRLRFRRDNDLTGPPPDMGDRHVSPRRADSRSAGDVSAETPVQPTGRTELDPETEAAINQALAQGHKINAIKILREATGLDLKTSKETIDRW